MPDNKNGVQNILVVDLDGTLIRTDTLHEQFLALLRSSISKAFMAIILLLLKGRAAFKSYLSCHVNIDVALLPYNRDMIGYLKLQRENGRKIIMATAANIKIAQSVADYLGLFEDVIASDETRNLKGVHKANVLVERFGKGRFTYAGDSRADLAVWKESGGAIFVGNSKSLLAAIPVPVEAEFSSDSSKLIELLKAMRIYQWVKNILVFVPIVAAGQIYLIDNWLSAASAIVGFSLVASGVYLLNDLLDLEADRCHERKKHRPFASGTLPIHYGILVVPMLWASGLAVASWGGIESIIVLLTYGVLTTVYSFYFKLQPLVDVFVLAGLYSIRIFGGGVASGYLPSTWLLSFSGLLFLSLAFLKRYVETVGMEKGEGNLSRRSYRPGESLIQLMFGIASGFSSVIVFALWLDSAAFSDIYSSQILLWLITPLILLWICHLWLAGFRGAMHDDPIVYTARDRVSWLIFSLAALFYVLGLMK